MHDGPRGEKGAAAGAGGGADRSSSSGSRQQEHAAPWTAYRALISMGERHGTTGNKSPRPAARDAADVYCLARTALIHPFRSPAALLVQLGSPPSDPPKPAEQSRLHRWSSFSYAGAATPPRRYRTSIRLVPNPPRSAPNRHQPLHRIAPPRHTNHTPHHKRKFSIPHRWDPAPGSAAARGRWSPCRCTSAAAAKRGARYRSSPSTKRRAATSRDEHPR